MRETNFKQTELGLIPHDWEIKTLGELGSFVSGSGFPLKFQGHKQGIIPFYKVSDMNIEGNDIVMSTANNYLSDDVWEIFRPIKIPPRAIVYAKIGAAIYLERKRLTSSECCIDNNMQAFVCGETINFKYMHYSLLCIPFAEKVSSTALPAINTNDLKTILVSVPSKREQAEIANTLSNCDDLISGLKKLIEKKRAIKAGAMSQLLSGKLRLPGFSEPWHTVSLDDVSQFANVTLPCDMFEDENYVCTENMIPECGGITAYEDIVPYMYAKSYVPFDILLSNIRPYLKKLWLADTAGCCSNDVLAIRPNFELVSPNFLYYCISQDCFFNYVMEGVSGTKMPRGNKTHIAKYEFEVPSDLEEQKAIAKVLTDMDEEISALEAKLNKYEQLKKGMMQQLLTGKIRLVSPNESLS